MGLDMNTRKKIYAEVYTRYQKAGKKEKGVILDQYTQDIGCNRDYMAHLLANWGKPRYAVADGKPIRLIARPPSQTEKSPRRSRRKTPGNKKIGRPVKYHKEYVKALSKIWMLFDFQCGKLLAPFIRSAIDFLADEFSFGEEVSALLLSASPATIDRALKHAKESRKRKGLCTTRPGTLLKNQIPIRVCFDRSERRPGFLELDTVSHCGTSSKGQFCQTLTITDIGSGWTELYALLNNAHRWVKERIACAYTTLPFPMLGIDSDNGGEFVNHQLFDWCVLNNVKFTRGRPYRKNDNCFVEQKNWDVVRRNVGYTRYEGQAAADALSLVYQFLNLLQNYFYPTLRLAAKEKLPSGKYRKVYEKDAKTPYQRLLDSPVISEEHKEKLRQRKAGLNPIALKLALDKAKLRLLKLPKSEATLPSQDVSCEILG